MGLFEWYRRWRHSRGFGVHSPYGFRIICRVLRHDRHARYGDADIRRALAGCRSHAKERNARMLLRLVADLRPRAVFLPADSHAVYPTAILAADSSTRLIRNPRKAEESDLLCSARDLVPLPVILSHLAHPGASLALIDAPEGWIESISEALPEGVMFAGKTKALAIHRPQTAKVVYSVKL